MLEERNQRCRNRHKLLRADVDVIHFIAIDENKVTRLTSINQLAGDASLVVEFNIRLRNRVTIFFPRRQRERKRLDLNRFLLPVFEIRVDLLHLALLGIIADLKRAVSGVNYNDVVDDASVLYLAIRRLDEAVIVDARKAAQRRYQSNVRTFRRFNRTDASIVRRMYVAHFESSAFARQTARPKSRETPLVRNLRQRICLIHELRQLRRPEEFADRSHHWLRVDQVVRHRRRHFLVHAHLFLDRAFHADQADAELIFQQLANRADAAIAQVIDVIHRADVLTQLQQVLDRRVEIVRIKRALLEARRFLIFKQLDVELQAAHTREVILARIEEHALK